LAGEAELGTHMVVVELHRSRDLSDIVVLPQLLLLAEGVADDERVADAVVVDQRSRIAERRPDPRPEVVLHRLVEPRAD
jgi:hypothetical protein